MVLQILKSQSLTGFPYTVHYNDYIILFPAMLGIRHGLVRIRILGSVNLTSGPGCGSGRAKKYGSYRSGSGFGTLVHLHYSSKIKKIIKKLYRLHTAILDRPPSSAATMEVQGPDTQ